jgi:aryl-alcohol dehydrogenase-like predicted oxidoreductase
MIILNPLEPWPGELVLGAAEQAGVRLITRVVDYGGLLWGDLPPGTELTRPDHRAFRPAGWIDAGAQKIEAIRPIAQRTGLTTLQLACQWNLAHAPVACVAPTLIQEVGPAARPIEDQRAELAALPFELRLTTEEIDEIRRIGDNSGCMALKGASPAHAGEEQPDRWTVDERLQDVARRWAIEPERDLVEHGAPV